MQIGYPLPGSLAGLSLPVDHADAHGGAWEIEARFFVVPSTRSDSRRG